MISRIGMHDKEAPTGFGRWRVAAAVLVSVVALAAAGTGCGPDTRSSPASPSASSPGIEPALSPYYEQQLDWQPCGSGFTCTKADVPLDYDQPGGERIQLSLIRLPSADPARRIGSLFVNPGGPGASGVRYARSARDAFDPKVLDHFDVIGFDPRGVGESAPIRCLTGSQTDKMLATLGQPDTHADPAAVAREAATFGAGCQAMSPALTPNIGTAATVRDLDILRQLAGDDRLNFLGRSYGTFIGAKYAAQFPDRVGRFVLDGAIVPTLTLAELARGQAEGFELALGRFVSDCLRRSDCPVSRRVGKAMGGAGSTDSTAGREAGIAVINRWLRKLAARPIRHGNRELTRPLAQVGLLGALYEPSYGWPDLRRVLRAGLAGNAGPMIDLVDAFFGRQGGGKYTDGAFDALYAVNCLDHDDRAGVDETDRLAAEWSAAAPIFGAYFAWGNLPCATWPAPATERPGPVSANGSGPILVIGTTYDPATPFPWAEQLAAMLANSSLLIWEGDGHTAYRRGSACVDRVADTFLTTGQLPPDGQRC